MLVIVKAFKTWRYNLKDYKYKILLLIYHNNVRLFMNTKHMISQQVCLAQKLLKFYFQLDYYDGKANEAIDAISQYFQRNTKE